MPNFPDNIAEIWRIYPYHHYLSVEIMYNQYKKTVLESEEGDQVLLLGWTDFC